MLEPVLMEIHLNTSQKLSVKNCSIFPYVTDSIAGPLMLRKLFLPHFLNFRCKPVTFGPFISCGSGE